ncbi:MAG TPA: hypothetical protein VGV09_17955 [Steroidobacteraceae bacterium]|nr:hypothetical protein [Steroidobacteraceae bacterium]
MSDPDDLDAQLIARFEREHTHVPAEPFAAATLREIRRRQQRASRLRTGLRVAALLVLIVASPWLIAGVEELNVALDASLYWTAHQPVAWVFAAAGVVALAGVRILRSR